MTKAKRDSMGMTARERQADYKAFVKSKGPAHAKQLKADRKANREKIYGVGYITRGKNAGLTKGTGKQKPKK